MKKRVLFTLYRNKCHSLYRQFLSCPPKGYEYLTLDDTIGKNIFSVSESFFGNISNKIKRNRLIINSAIRNDIDLIYCCDGILLFASPLPWVVDIEHVTSFVAHNFNLWRLSKWAIPAILLQRNLKFIIPWTKAGAQSIRMNLRLSEMVMRKIVPIHLCLENTLIQPLGSKKKIRKSSATLLFVTSVNYNSDVEFFSKGGKIVVAIYERLISRGVDIRLILRSKLPETYDYLRKDPLVSIYQDTLDSKDFSSLFLQSDIFLFPGYQSPGMAFLEAMNHSLPILATDVFANGEMVHEGVNGFLAKFPDRSKVHYLQPSFGIKLVPSSEFSRTDSDFDCIVEKLSEKIVWFLSNPKEMERFGKMSKNLLQKGFSLGLRNKKLGEIFDISLRRGKKKSRGL